MQFVSEAIMPVDNRERKQESVVANFTKVARSEDKGKKHKIFKDGNIHCDSSNEANVTSITTQVRKTVLKYINGHQNELGKLENMQETRSFFIIVRRIASKEKCLFCVEIRCEACGKQV